MKFTCNRDALIEGINIVQKAIPGKSTLPVLEGILIEVGEELILTGSDNDISITYEVPSIIEEIGGVVVSSKTFGEIIRKLPDIYLTIETAEEGRSLIIDSGNAHFEITYMEKSGYPKVDPLDTTDSLSISQNNLKTFIRQTAFSASQDNTRPILKGVLVENKSGLLNFVALDGFSLAIKTIDSSYDKDFSMIVSARVLLLFYFTFRRIYDILQLSEILDLSSITIRVDFYKDRCSAWITLQNLDLYIWLKFFMKNR